MRLFQALTPTNTGTNNTNNIREHPWCENSSIQAPQSPMQSIENSANSIPSAIDNALGDPASINTFPLAIHHMDSSQGTPPQHLDWQRINALLTAKTHMTQNNESTIEIDPIYKATNYHWVAGLNEYPLARTNYHWEAPCHEIQIPNPHQEIPLDELSVSTLGQSHNANPSNHTIDDAPVFEDDNSSISTMSYSSLIELNNPVSPPNNETMGTTENVTIPPPPINNLSLRDEVHRIVTGTSQKFVPQPSFDQVATDAFQGLKRFATTLRLKENYRLQHHKNSDASTTTSSTPSSTTSIIDPPSVGLKTKLKPTRCSGASKGSNYLESFLKDVTTAILDMVWAYRNFTSTTPLTEDIHHLQTLLHNNPAWVVIPTDKTNSFQLIPKQHYVQQVQQHLSQRAKPISHSDLQTVRERGLQLLRHLKPSLSSGEYGYLSQSLASYAIPTPKLAIKDHKKPDNNGQYPTRLIVPAQNFVAAFPKMGYMALKKIFDDNNIQYMSNIIIQASHLKTQLEQLKLNSSDCTIASLDAEAYYPSVRYKLVAKAVKHFSTNLPESIQNQIDMCMQMILFGMKSTYIVFQDSYYEYDGDQDDDNRGLTIGGYESAFLSDLVGAYLLECTANHFQNTKFRGLYRDDGLVVFQGQLTHAELLAWRNQFQNHINQIAEGDYLQFTMEIWADQATQPMAHPPINKKDPVQVNNTSHFPYLDMELHWHNHQDLHFKVHLKPNQQLLYLNKESTHTTACFNAIPLGVCHRLAKLTTITNENANTSLKTLYPNHFAALEHANLINNRTMPVIPTLQEAINTYRPVSPSTRALQQPLLQIPRNQDSCRGGPNRNSCFRNFQEFLGIQIPARNSCFLALF